jgi:hypothetical protein
MVRADLAGLPAPNGNVSLRQLAENLLHVALRIEHLPGLEAESDHDDLPLSRTSGAGRERFLGTTRRVPPWGTPV